MHISIKQAAAIAALMGSAFALHAETNVNWTSLGNGIGADGRPAYTERFTVTGDMGFGRLAFNRFARRMTPADSTDRLVEVVPGYYYIDSPRLAAAAPGDTVTIDLEVAGSIRSICYAPDGVHGVSADGKPLSVIFSRASLDTDPALWRLPDGTDVMPYADAVFAATEKLAIDAEPTFFDAIPSYKSVKYLPENECIGLKKVTFKDIKDSRPDYFRATFSKNKVLIECAPEARANALRRLNIDEIKGYDYIPAAVIEDWPDFPYRGVMIDIARNYQTPAEMGRVLHLMSRYGLNHLHFHFADDEAWRLEIPGFPELTEVGGRRGYTTDEADFMAQIFTGNGNPDAVGGTTNGHFTRAEFIDMIRLADSLGIKVVPEIESPGHARAAIRAMERRYRLTGDDTYRLIDPADTSKYTSAQSFHDNVMNPAIPGPVRFMTDVIGEIKKMYDEAGIAMPAIHIGGDEVAMGAWRGSPIAQTYMAERGITDERRLHLIFVTELVANLTAMGVPVSGWQEIAVGHDDAFNKAVRPHTYSVNCWSTLGKKAGVTVQSAQAGYPTVLSNVDHFYLDMCYTPHPQEYGLSWGGYVDELDALHGYPKELCPVDSADFKNVIGVSGHLFSETIRSPRMLETFLLPKMMGLAERAWNMDPTYTDAEFTAVVARDLSSLIHSGYTVHVAQPGISVTDGMARMNHRHGADIRYTFDGSEPTAESTLYTEAIAVPEGTAQIRAKAFMPGSESATSILELVNQ